MGVDPGDSCCVIHHASLPTRSNRVTRIRLKWPFIKPWFGCPDPHPVSKPLAFSLYNMFKVITCWVQTSGDFSPRYSLDIPTNKVVWNAHVSSLEFALHSRNRPSEEFLEFHPKVECGCKDESGIRLPRRILHSNFDLHRLVSMVNAFLYKKTVRFLYDVGSRNGDC
jgi:hypothetical protein